MKPSIDTTRLAPLWRVASSRGMALAVIAGGAPFVFAGVAHAIGSGPAAGSIGAQLNLMSDEFTNSGGTAVTMMLYLLGIVLLLFGVWALWQAHQARNRGEGGHYVRGAVGLVLCGLCLAAPSWINKASVTTSGGAASITGAGGMMTFGGGG